MIPKLAPIAVLCACTLLALPTLAAAAPSGGAPAPGATPTAGEPAPPVAATPRTTSVAGSNGIAFSVRTGAFVGRASRVRGTAPARHTVTVQTLTPGGAWTSVASARTDRHGKFLARWTATHLGPYRVRVVLASAQARAASTSAASPIAGVMVFHPALATWYGPGFYGQRTACGQVLTHATLGIAHRTLPCGTPVAIMYDGRSIVVPVIDRGPYANGADFDLTAATSKTLGMTETSTIGEVALVGSRAAAF